MAYLGDSPVKRLLQTPFSLMGYKVVRKKPYEARTFPLKSRAKTDFNKLFCIGFNKTGTTTLEAVLRENGFAMPKQVDQEATLQHVLDNTKLDVLNTFIGEYDAFQDVPFSQQNTYIACDALYPGSKFILTMRHPDEWVESYIKYYSDAFDICQGQEISEQSFKDKNLYLETNYVHRLFSRSLATYNGVNIETDWKRAFDKAYLKSIYARRNAEIVWYFSERPQDLLVIDVSEEKDTDRLLSFLSVGTSGGHPFPRLNARA